MLSPLIIERIMENFGCLEHCRNGLRSSDFYLNDVTLSFNIGNNSGLGEAWGAEIISHNFVLNLFLWNFHSNNWSQNILLLQQGDDNIYYLSTTYLDQELLDYGVHCYYGQPPVKTSMYAMAMLLAGSEQIVSLGISWNKLSSSKINLLHQPSIIFLKKYSHLLK